MTAEEKSKPIEGTGLIAAKCPVCGGILSIKKGGEVRCEFCGSKFFLHESYRGKSKEIRNYYDLAYAAQESGDDETAYKYFTKVLELDSTEALAWFGKAISVLRGSAASQAGIKEALTLFGRVLPNAAAEEEEQLRKAIQESCFSYGNAFFKYLRNRSWGTPNVTSSRAVWALVESADEVLPLDNEQLKQLVAFLCAYAFFEWSEREEKVKRYTERIRETEPGYLNPWEAEEERIRNLPPAKPFNWRPWAVGVLVITLMILFLLLACMILSLFTPPTSESTSNEGTEGLSAETTGVAAKAEGVAIPEEYLLIDVDGGLPLREAPDADSPIIRMAEKGEGFRVIGRDESGEWDEVETEDGPAWLRTEGGGDEPEAEVER